MRLLQLKIRGLGELPETDWLQIDRRINVISFEDSVAGTLFLKAIESLKPLTDCRITQPFQGLPLETRTHDGHRKVINPAKRTIAMGIFDSPASLVRELGLITPHLYETDRIEVGRRLDYSRWINFVELASSSRWSQISEDLRRLCDKIRRHQPGRERIKHLLTTMADSDRIKGHTARELEEWLDNLKSNQEVGPVVKDILEKVARWRQFKEARQLIEDRLPLMLRLPLINCSVSEMTTKIEDAAKQSSMPPIMLIDLIDERSSASVDECIALIQSRVPGIQSFFFVNGTYTGQGQVQKSIYIGKNTDQP